LHDVQKRKFCLSAKNYILNDDQYIQYFYWPQTREVQDAVLYFNSVSSLSDYYKRFIRITAGAKQLEKEFAKDRIKKCNDDLGRKIDNQKVKKFPLKYKIFFKLYRFLRFFMDKYVKFKLKNNKNYEWERIKQD